MIYIYKKKKNYQQWFLAVTKYSTVSGTYVIIFVMRLGIRNDEIILRTHCISFRHFILHVSENNIVFII